MFSQACWVLVFKSVLYRLSGLLGRSGSLKNCRKIDSPVLYANSAFIQTALLFGERLLIGGLKFPKARLFL